MKPYHLTIYLDDDDQAMLKELAKMIKTSRAEVFRTLIRVYHRKVRTYRETNSIPPGRMIWIATDGEIASPHLK